MRYLLKWKRKYQHWSHQKFFFVHHLYIYIYIENRKWPPVFIWPDANMRELGRIWKYIYTYLNVQLYTLAAGTQSVKARLHNATKTCDMRRATKLCCVKRLICATCDCCMLSQESWMISIFLQQHATVDYTARFWRTSHVFVASCKHTLTVFTFKVL